MLARFSAIAGALLLSFAAPALAQPRPFTANDLARLERVSDPRVSPDGRYVAYSVRATDWENNKGVSSVWLIDRQGAGGPRRLAASDGGASGARWSSDGRRLYFLSSRSKSSQVWSTDVQGRTATQVTDLTLDVGAFRLSPDGRRIVVSAAVFPDCGPDEIACTKQRLDAQATRKASGVLHTKTFVRHWDEWANGTRNHLFALNLDASGKAAGAPTALTPGFDGDVPSKPFGDEADFVFTPDGSALIFAARQAGRTEPWSTNFDLWRVPITGGVPQNITPQNPAWDAAPVVSPDGRQLAWLAMRRPGFEADRFAVMVRDLATGAQREVAPRWDRSPDKVAWSPDGRTLYATAQDVGQTRVFAVDVAAGRVTPLTGEGHVAGFDLGAGDLVYAQDDLDSPAQLWRQPLAGGAAPVRLTDHNAAALENLRFGAYRQFEFKGWRGETVRGFVMQPADFQPGRRYPVAFIVHGGPQSSFGNAWSYRWNPQTYAGAGYGVVFIDFHGSTGYGQAFTDSITEHWGDRPLEDLQKGWAAALKANPWLDGERACALGASYGGYMINWMAGNWGRPWKCLVNHDGIFDTRMMGYSTEELWFTEWESGGTPWERPEEYERFNPARFVKNWRTPMLVIHGGNDFRVPLEQGLATFNALQRRDVPSQFLYFPDENHWVLKPQNSVQWHETVLAWLNRWTTEGGQAQGR